MKSKKTLWIILIVLLAVAIALAIVLPRISGRGAAPDDAAPEEEQETIAPVEGAEQAPDTEPSSAPAPEATVDPELPMDQSELTPAEDEQTGEIRDAEEPQPGSEVQPVDPGPNEGGESGGGSAEDSGIDEDELPIIP